MSQQQVDKTEMIDNLLKSLHYNEEKEDTTIIEHLCIVFKVPNRKRLRSYLINKVDFSELFSAILVLIEPFAQMMNEIYGFLAKQRKTAYALQHITVGENIKDKISFDLEAFPPLYQRVSQLVEGYLRSYNLKDVLNSNISPLFLTEELMACGHCSDIHYQKTAACRECDFKMRLRFEKVFDQLAQLIEIIPEEIKQQRPYSWHCRYFVEANEHFQGGTHWEGSCLGYKEWSERLDRVEQRIELVSKVQPGLHEIETLVRFFELPFWKERNRLYEIWTLIHFISLLQEETKLSGASLQLNISNDEWNLVYGDAKKPVALLRGPYFEIEVWYQNKLKKGLKVFANTPVEPEMIVTCRRFAGAFEPLVLIECKERKDYDIREIKKLSTFYRDQVNTELNIFCNYYDYSSFIALESSNDKSILLCGQFRPGSKNITKVDDEFLQIMRAKISLPLYNVLIDVSAKMRGKDPLFVYQKLYNKLLPLFGIKGISGVFAEHIILCNYDELAHKLRNATNIGFNAELENAVSLIRKELQINYIELSASNLYIITDLTFGVDDWMWLTRIASDTSYNITFVARKSWIGEKERQRIERLEKFKLLLY